MRSISASSTGAPSTARTRAGRSRTLAAGSFHVPASPGGRGSWISGCSSRKRFTRCAAALAGNVGSRFFSKRVDASVRRPRRAAVRRTAAGWKLAHSSRSSLVSAVTREASPPITPPIATTSSPDVIRTSSGWRARSTPSSVRVFSPGRASHTTIPRASSRARSNRWFSCPRSSITKFERSTSRSSGRWPTASRSARIQSGALPFFTPEIGRPT